MGIGGVSNDVIDPTRLTLKIYIVNQDGFFIGI